MSEQLHVRWADLEWPDKRQYEIELECRSVSSTMCGCFHKHSCDKRQRKTRLHGDEISRVSSTEAYLTCNCSDILWPSATAAEPPHPTLTSNKPLARANRVIAAPHLDFDRVPTSVLR